MPIHRLFNNRTVRINLPALVGHTPPTGLRVTPIHFKFPFYYNRSFYETPMFFEKIYREKMCGRISPRAKIFSIQVNI
jgi:hypothetical protein